MCGISGASASHWCVYSTNGKISISPAGFVISQSNAGFVVADAAYTNYMQLSPTGEIFNSCGNINMSPKSKSDGTQACYVKICGGSNGSTGLGGNICLVGGSSTLGSGGNVYIDVDNFGGTNNGQIYLCGLTGKTSETCVVYINAAGKLTTGTVSGSGCALTGYTCVNRTSLGINSLPYGAGGGSMISIGSCNITGGTGGCNITIGDCVLRHATTGFRNISIGYKSLFCATTANYNLAIGHEALCCSTGGFNIAIGDKALGCNQGGVENVAVGINSLLKNTSGNYNIALGGSAMGSNQTGCYNIAIGQQTSYTNTAGHNNIAFGRDALWYNCGSCNIGFGYWSLYCNTFGTHNIAIGYSAARCNLNGGNIIAIGNQALLNNTGSNNIAIGQTALCLNVGGTQNIGIGIQALLQNTSGNYNVAIGGGALFSGTTGSRNVGIGYNAGYNETGSDKLHIANSNLCTLICGDFAAKTVCIDNCLYVNSITCPSDCRLKTNVGSISIAPVSVEYKQFNHRDTPDKISVGVIAQELCITHPDLVSIDDKGYLGINYGELHSLEIAYLKCRVSELEKKLSDLIKE